MGCVPSKSSVKPSKTSASNFTLKDNFTGLKGQLLSLTYKLHDLLLSCANEIEDLVIRKEKTFALLLMKKKFCIRKKQKELQIVFAKYDNCLENVPFNVKEKAEIEKEIEHIQSDSEEMIVFDKDMKFEMKDAEFISKFEAEVMAFGVDQGLLEKELDHEFEVQSTVKSEGDFIRKKFAPKIAVLD